MNWSDYYYLAICVFCALTLLALMSKMIPALTAKHPRPSRKETLILVLVLTVGIFTIYGRFLVGEAFFAYRDTGLDTIDQYVPFYLDLLDSIRDGSFGAWNFDYGLGTSALSYQSWLLDPFNLALIPLGLLLGDAKLSLVLVIVQMLKIILSGILFNRLAARFCETPLARILGSTLYAFGGYLLLWGQHYWLGSVSVAFIALVLVLERLAESWSAGRFLGVVSVSAVCVGWSPYCGFMMLVSAAIYMLLRLIHLAEGPHPARQVATGTGKLLAPVLCGVLLAGIVLVPYVLYLFSETGRISSAEQPSLLARSAAYFTEFVPLRWLPGIASRLLGNSLITSGGELPLNLIPATESFPYVNCYEFIALGFGACSIMLLAQFFHWAATETTRCTKILLCAATVIIIAYCVNSFLPALLNAFVAPKFRSSFVLAVPLCLALSIGWEKRVQAGKVARPSLLVSGALTLAVLAWSLANTVDGRAICLFCLLCACFFALILFMRWPKRIHAVLMLSAAAFVLMPVIADGFFITNNRLACTENSFPEASAAPISSDTEAALAYLRQTDDSLYRVEKTYTDWCDFNDALIEGYHGVNSYNSTTDGEVIDFYRVFWPGALENGEAYQSYANDADGLSLISQLGTRYLLSKAPIDSSSLQLLSTFGKVRVYRNLAETAMLSATTRVAAESDVFNLKAVEERRSLLSQAVVVPDEIAASWDADAGRSAKAAFELALTGNSKIQGTIATDVDMVARLSIPHTAGWSVTVDGQEVQTFRANLGFIGFELSAGQHEVEAHYAVARAEQGVAVSIFGALASLTICLYSSRRTRAVY